MFPCSRDSSPLLAEARQWDVSLLEMKKEHIIISLSPNAAHNETYWNSVRVSPISALPLPLTCSGAVAGSPQEPLVLQGRDHHPC